MSLNPNELTIDDFLRAVFPPPPEKPEDLFPSEFSLEKELDTGWPWPLDAAQRFFENMYNAIVNIAYRVWDFFQEKLRDALKWMWESIVIPLWRYARETFEITVTWTADWPEPWASIVRFFLFPTAFAYRFTRDFIIARLGDAVRQLQVYFDGAVGGVFNAIRNAFSPLFDPLAKFADVVWKFLTETMPSWLRQAGEFFVALPQRLWESITKLGETVASTITNALSSFGEAARKFFLETVPKMLFDFATWLASKLTQAFKEAWNWINQNVVPPLREAARQVWETIVNTIRNLVSMFLDYINRLRGHAERGNIAELILEGLPLAAASAAIAMTLDLAGIKVMGTGIDLNAVRSQVVKFLDALFDPKLFTSVFLAIAVQRPLEYTVRYMFRTEIPSPSDLLRFYSKGWIDLGKLKEGMARHGYSDEWISIYERSVWREPTFDAVFTALKRGAISEGDYRRWLNILNILQEPRPGMEKADVVIFEEAMYRMPSPFVLAQAVETGVLALEDVKKVLEYELVHPQFVDAFARALVERSLRDDKALVRRFALEGFTEGILSLGDLQTILQRLNISAEFIDILTPLISTVRERKLRAKTISYLEKAFLDGYIERDAFESQLLALGLDPEVAHRYVMLMDYVRRNYYAIKETRDERNKYASLIEDMVVKGVMSQDEARYQLLGLGFTPEEVELRLRRAKLSYENEIRKLQLDSLIEGIRQGLIDRTSFTDACTRLGYSFEKCRELGEYYWRKYVGLDFYVVTKDERNALANALVKLYLAGFMTEAELRKELRNLGFLDLEVDLRIKRAEVEDRLQTMKELLAEADTMLKRGEITPEEYIRYLTELGMRRDRAEARARRILAGKK